jgi:glutaredoxin
MKIGGWIAAKRQQCSVPSLYVPWLMYFAGLAFFVYKRNRVGALLWLVLVPAAKVAYLRYFPYVSRLVGYGRIEDKLPSSMPQAPVAVTYYSFLGCPFCPIVLQRLLALQKQMGFTLTKIDVTLKPQLLANKHIQSVPVVEVGHNRLVGNSTTEQLAALVAPALSLKSAPALAQAS